ncbi:MAG: energy transducer TonB [Reyranella sp.]|nr:energy transducer TonB [Reyranella sp.]
MIPAVSALSHRSDRMSPPALALAVLLHALVILALWWMSTHRPTPAGEEAVEITFEIPKTPEPPPPPPQSKQAPPVQAAPMPLGLPPPAPLLSNRPTQVPQAPVQPKELPPTPPLPSSREAAATAAATPAPVQPAPVPAPTLPELVAPRPAAPAPQRPDLRPSPLAPTPQRPPAAASTAEPSPHPFVNPADAFAKARLADNYLWQVARKIVGYHYQANTNVRQGTSVVRIVIARDGRLLGAEIVRSSGVPEFDRGVLAGVRAGAPYTPLPPEIKGESASFDLPLVSVSR